MVSNMFDITEYHKPLVGPYGYKEDCTSYAFGGYYYSVEMLTLVESSKNN